jgi:hypothetical protein
MVLARYYSALYWARLASHAWQGEWRGRGKGGGDLLGRCENNNENRYGYYLLKTKGANPSIQHCGFTCLSCLQLFLPAETIFNRATSPIDRGSGIYKMQNVLINGTRDCVGQSKC